MKSKNIYIFYLLAAAFGMLMTNCSKFLEETPNKAGSAYVNHIDQLFEIMGSPDLYMFADSRDIDFEIIGDFTTEQAYMNDAVDYSPDYFSKGQRGVAPFYKIYCLDNADWTQTQSRLGQTWTPAWERIYRFNTVLENIDKVEQTTQNIHDQVAGEAYFGRAYYHFMLMVQYCLWNEKEPGIGYRVSTKPSEVPDRETVGYTLSHIYDDLVKSEEYLTKAGAVKFDVKTNFRPTVPTVKAFKARVDLYRGKYESALQNADEALAAHSTLVDISMDFNYMLFPTGSINFLDETNTKIENSVTANVPMMLWSIGAQLASGYEELYLPNCTRGNNLPMSESFYNLFDKENDLRWITFYNAYMPVFGATGLRKTMVIDGVPTSNCISWEDQQWLKPQTCHSYYRFASSGSPVNILGMTTAEMYLIKAECLARSSKTAEATDVLKTLRANRFVTPESAEAIGGSVQDILDERLRELGSVIRFFDIKRLNGSEKAGISVNRKILSDIKDPSSVIELTIAPDDGRWALPFYLPEAENMGWEQNRGW